MNPIPPKNALSILAASILAGLATALVGSLRIAALILADAPVRIWPPDRPEVVTNLAFAVLVGLLLLASFVLLLLGLSRLLRATHPAVPAWLRVPWVFLSALTDLWPLVILLPAALRLRARKTAVVAVFAGLLFAAALPLNYLSPWPDFPLPDLASLISLTLLAYAVYALAAPLGVPRRPLRIACSVASAIFVIHFWPLFLRTPIPLQDRADALIARILDRCESPLRPGAPIPWAHPPVAPEDDPIAALSPDALKEDAFIADKLDTLLNRISPRPLSDAHIALLASWLDSHPALETAANALCGPYRSPRPLSDVHIDHLTSWLDSHPTLEEDTFIAPSYRSSLPGLATADGFASIYDNFDANWLEPRLAPSGIGPACARLLRLRDRLAAARGDPAAATIANAQLQVLAAKAAQTPTLIGLLYTRTYLPFPTDLAHFDDRTLASLVTGAQSLADWADSCWATWFAGEILFCNAHLDDEPTALLDYLPCWRRLLYAARPRWVAAASWNACLRDLLDMTTPDGLLPATRAPAWDEFSSLYEFPTHLALFRRHADLLATAVAIERHRRATGTLPPTLDALVPSYLPALPDLAYAPETRSLPEQTLTLPTLDDLRLEYRQSCDAPFPPLDTPLDDETLKSLLDAWTTPPPSGPTVTLPAVSITGYTLTPPPSRPGRPSRPVFFPVPS